MSTSPKTLRTRNMTAAKRSLKLILEEAQSQLATLENGGVPDSGFMPSVLKYEQARTALDILLTLGEDGPADDGTGEVRLDDLGLFIRLVHQVVPGTDALQADSPLGRLAAVAYPGGLPAPSPDQES